MKMNADEKALLESVERGEWKSAKSGKRERARYSRYAKATFRKDRRLNIRLSKAPGSDPEASARGGSTLPDGDFEPVAQVRVRPAQGGLTTSIIPIPRREGRTRRRRLASSPGLPPTPR